MEMAWDTSRGYTRGGGNGGNCPRATHGFSSAVDEFADNDVGQASFFATFAPAFKKLTALGSSTLACSLSDCSTPRPPFTIEHPPAPETTEVPETTEAPETTVPVSNGLFSGDQVFLTAHTGKQLEVEDTIVQARWFDRGSWQTFTIENEGRGAILSGDVVFLTAHTGNLVDVQGESVQARWRDYGNWQQIVVEKIGGGPLFTGDLVFLQAHTNQLIDVQDSAVRARWSERGAWQTLTIDKADAQAPPPAGARRRQARRLAGSSPENSSSGAPIGFVLGVSGVLVCTALALVAVRHQKPKLVQSNRSEKVHPVSANE